jgi:hypothetical protein
MTWFRYLAFIAALLSTVSLADDSFAEIDYLLRSIGVSSCTFIRNGERHAATEAESHLRMKYQRGQRYATNAELFIERLASRSSLTREPYWVECPDTDPVMTSTWLTRRLDELRGATNTPGQEARR